MNLEEALARMQLALRTDSYTQREMIMALDAALNELNAQCDIVFTEQTKNLTAFSNEIDLSTITGFLPERLRYAEIGYNDRSTWATAQSYAVNDLVQGDGDPDSYLYVCTTAHTSASGNEPPNSTYWSRVRNKRGTRLRTRPYDDVTQGPLPPDDVAKPAWSRRGLHGYPPNGYQGGVTNGPFTPDRPQFITFPFPSAPKAYVAPTPEIAYPLVLIFRKPFALLDADIEDPSTVTIEIDDEYMRMAVDMGAPAIIEYPDPTDRAESMWWSEFQAHIKRIKDRTAQRGAVSQRRPNFRGL